MTIFPSVPGAAAPCILDLRDSPWVDGPGRTVLEIAEALGRRGYRYIIGAMVREHEARNSYLTEARRRGLEVLPIRERGPLDHRVLQQVRDALRRHHVAILHTHEFRSDLIGRLCAHKAGVRLVTTAHGWIANDWKGRLYTVLDKMLVRGFDRVIVVSRNMKRQLRRYGVAPDKIEVVPNTLMTETYRPDRSDDRFRRELGVAAEETLIANIGRLSREKGQAVFLQAAARIVRDHPRMRFALVGIGPDEAALRALATRLGIGERVHFVGYREDMHTVYNGVDLVVQSSHTEGMPNVVLEALLMRVPVIATDVGGTGEIIESGRYGILVKPGDPTLLAHCMVEFAKARERHRIMAQAGGERVRREFDSIQRIERIEQIYRSLLADGRASAFVSAP